MKTSKSDYDDGMDSAGGSSGRRRHPRRSGRNLAFWEVVTCVAIQICRGPQRKTLPPVLHAINCSRQAGVGDLAAGWTPVDGRSRGRKSDAKTARFKMINSSVGSDQSRCRATLPPPSRVKRESNRRRAISRIHGAAWNRLISRYMRAMPAIDRKSTRLNSSHIPLSRMPSSA